MSTTNPQTDDQTAPTPNPTGQGAAPAKEPTQTAQATPKAPPAPKAQQGGAGAKAKAEAPPVEPERITVYHLLRDMPLGDAGALPTGARVSSRQLAAINATLEARLLKMNPPVLEVFQKITETDYDPEELGLADPQAVAA